MKIERMKRLALLAFSVTIAAAQSPDARPGNPASYKPKRVNKAIELLEHNQPVFYVGAIGGYEEGRRLARTWADYIEYQTEHGPFDITRLHEFMRGLVDGGPGRSGHRTPAVIVALPATGFDEAAVRANTWMVQQALAAGVHGILLSHARTPGAARALVEAARYPFAPKAKGLGEGLRGSGSQTHAAQVWGITAADYLHVADLWPLNPIGELMLGISIEDRHALANAEITTKVPGLAFADWGPGDMRFSLGLVNMPTGVSNPASTAALDQARNRVLAACKVAKLAFSEAMTLSNVADQLRAGVRIASAPPEVAEKARRLTKREMPW